jgi:hypothetical protein
MRSVIITAIVGIVAIVSIPITLTLTHFGAPVQCRFDGGGTLSVGSEAETTEHTFWVCREDGTLVQVKIP